jgi:GNAT superfamily N-acetyltransferase
VRLAKPSDIPKHQRIDPWPKEPIWQHKIAGGEVIVLELSTEIIGLIRYEVLWTTVPFMGLIFIEEAQRDKGCSTLLLEFLKNHLREQGYLALLSSSQPDKPEPQAWHGHMGFKSNGIMENIADDDVGEIVYRIMLLGEAVRWRRGVLKIPNEEMLALAERIGQRLKSVLDKAYYPELEHTLGIPLLAHLPKL